MVQISRDCHHLHLEVEGTVRVSCRRVKQMDVGESRIPDPQSILHSSEAISQVMDIAIYCDMFFCDGEAQVQCVLCLRYFRCPISNIFNINKNRITPCNVKMLLVPPVIPLKINTSVFSSLETESAWSCSLHGWAWMPLSSYHSCLLYWTCSASNDSDAKWRVVWERVEQPTSQRSSYCSQDLMDKTRSKARVNMELAFDTCWERGQNSD